MYEDFPQRKKTPAQIRAMMRTVGRMPEIRHLTVKALDSMLVELNAKIKEFDRDVYFHRCEKDVFLMRISRNPFDGGFSHVGTLCGSLDNRYVVYLMEVRLRAYLDEVYESSQDNDHDWATYVFDGAFERLKGVV